VNTINGSLRMTFLALPMLGLLIAGCEPPQASRPASMPPAYTSNKITDPALRKVADDVKAWAAKQVNADRKPIYSTVEVLPPVPIVQPYGVGVFQEEMRLSVILTTGPGWAGLKADKKEAAVAEAFRQITEQLKTLDHEPALKTTLTVQTPQGMELTWINHLDPSRKNVHGDE
jgi:hypothetical protein